MKVKQLREILESQPEENDELEVRIFADHGQHAMPADDASKGWIEENIHMPEGIIHPDDLEEYDDPVPVFIIS